MSQNNVGGHCQTPPVDCVSIQSQVSSHRSPLRFLVLFSFQRTTTVVHCPFYTFNLDVSIRGLNRSVGNNLVEHSGGLLFCPSFNSLLSHDKGGSHGYIWQISAFTCSTNFAWAPQNIESYFWSMDLAITLENGHDLVFLFAFLSASGWPHALRIKAHCAALVQFEGLPLFLFGVKRFPPSWRGADSAAEVITANRARPISARLVWHQKPFTVDWASDLHTRLCICNKSQRVCLHREP